MIIALVHGISHSRPRDWWCEWMPHVQRLIGARAFQIQPINWEFLEERQPAHQLNWCTNLFGDLSAVRDPLINGFIRQELDRASWMSNGLIVISHSLGTVLTHYALTDMELPVRLWVTMGSPMWLRDKFPGLLPPGAKPPGVRRWVNVYSPVDWFVGRRAISHADANYRAWCRHPASHYFSSNAVWNNLPRELAAAYDSDEPLAA